MYLNNNDSQNLFHLQYYYYFVLEITLSLSVIT